MHKMYTIKFCEICHYMMSEKPNKIKTSFKSKKFLYYKLNNNKFSKHVLPKF